MREHLALTPSEVSAWLERAKEDGHSAFLLSTCNRFELYWYGDEVRETSFLEFARSRGAGDRIPLDRWTDLPRRATSLRSPPASIPKYSARPRSWVRCGARSISLGLPARPLERWTWFFHPRSQRGGGSGGRRCSGGIRRP